MAVGVCRRAPGCVAAGEGEHLALQVFGEGAIPLKVGLILLKLKSLAELLVRAGQERERLLDILLLQACLCLVHFCAEQLHGQAEVLPCEQRRRLHHLSCTRQQGARKSLRAWHRSKHAASACFVSVGLLPHPANCSTCMHMSGRVERTLCCRRHATSALAMKSLNSSVAASSRAASGAFGSSCFCSTAAHADAFAKAASAASSSLAAACSLPVCTKQANYASESCT